MPGGFVMSFINTLRVEPIPRTDKRKLLADLVYVHVVLGAIVVKKGFITDYATVPRVLWVLFPHDAGDTRRAAVLHDSLYVDHQKLSRAEVDKIFREALASDGASWFKRWSMWSAVMSFGWRYWK